MTTDAFRAPTEREKNLIKIRCWDRELAVVHAVSDGKFSEKYKVKILKLQDEKWYAECKVHSYLSCPFDKKETARLMGELHVKHFHVVR